MAELMVQQLKARNALSEDGSQVLGTHTSSSQMPVTQENPLTSSGTTLTCNPLPHIHIIKKKRFFLNKGRDM